MSRGSHFHASDIRGVSRLVVDAIIGIAHVVEAMHVNIAHLPGLPRPSISPPARGITGLVYRSVRLIAAGVGQALDAALAALVPLTGVHDSTPGREALLAAINGVLGDYLAAAGNPLAVSMRLRRNGHPLDLQRSALRTAVGRPSAHLLVMVHGLCMNDLQWRRRGRNPAETLALELGHTALYLHYNTGRHISTNGREFADLLERLVNEWPVSVESLTLVAHSMGGLVARSACHYAGIAAMRWPGLLRRMVFIATPHHGAPLERGGNWVDLLLGVSPYTAPLARLGKIRSAGITDLRYGNLVDEDWEGRDRFEGDGDRRSVIPLPAGVRCYAIAGSIVRSVGNMGHKLLGDGLVTVDSALGRHRDPHRALAFAEERQWVGAGMGHLELLSRARVWARIRAWLAGSDRDATRSDLLAG